MPGATASATWNCRMQSAILPIPPTTMPARVLVLMLPPPRIPAHLPGRALEMLIDDQALHLARALANLMRLDVAPVARHRILVHETIAAVDLHCLIGRALRRFRGVELGHGS